MSEINSYGKVWKYDDIVTKEQFSPLTFVEIEEKLDGSQFSASLINGNRHYRSKRIEVHPGEAGLFKHAVDNAEKLDLREGWTYRFEYLAKPRHNTLSYERTPTRHLALFEVETQDYRILPHSEMAIEAERIGVEATQLLWEGPMPNRKELDKLLENTSMLGKELIEGVVIKARTQRNNQDGKVLKAKVVSERFKERHKSEWKRTNPSQSDIIQRLGEALCTEARFSKARYALRDQGLLTGTKRDIGALMAELGRDLHEEEAARIKDELFKWAWPKIQRTACKGAPEWYIGQLEEAEEAKRVGKAEDVIGILEKS